MDYSIHQIENVLLEVKRIDSRIPILSIMGKLDPAKENDGYTLEEIKKAFEDALSEAPLVEEEGASLSIDELAPMSYSIEDLFNLFGEPKTSVEKIIDLYNDRVNQGIIKNQSQLASDSGIARSYISMLLNGQIEKVGDDNLKKFAKVFNVPKTYLEDASSTTYLVDMVYKEAKERIADEQHDRILTDIQIFEADYLSVEHPAVLAFCNLMRSKGYRVVYNASELGKDNKKEIQEQLKQETNRVIDSILDDALKASNRIEIEKKKAFPNLNVIEEAEMDIKQAKRGFYDVCMIQKAEHLDSKEETDFLKNLNLELYRKKKGRLSDKERECFERREKWVDYVAREKMDGTIMKKVLDRITSGKKRNGIYCEIIMTKDNDIKRFSIETIENFIDCFEAMFSMIKE